MARLKIFTKQKVAEGFFNDVDVVVFPGGDGEATAFRSVLKPNLADVRSYMQRGGKYLGICMGAYWADAYYFNLLQKTARASPLAVILRAKVPLPSDKD